MSLQPPRRCHRADCFRYPAGPKNRLLLEQTTDSGRRAFPHVDPKGVPAGRSSHLECHHLPCPAFPHHLPFILFSVSQSGLDCLYFPSLGITPFMKLCLPFVKNLGAYARPPPPPPRLLLLLAPPPPRSESPYGGPLFGQPLHTAPPSSPILLSFGLSPPGLLTQLQNNPPQAQG